MKECQALLKHFSVSIVMTQNIAVLPVFYLEYHISYTSWPILLVLILAITTTWFFVMYHILLGNRQALAVKVPCVKIDRLPRGFYDQTRKTRHTVLKRHRSSNTEMKKNAHL